MTDDPRLTPADGDLRDRIEEAIRRAAHSCLDDCDEPECNPNVSTRYLSAGGTVIEVEGTPEALADVMLAVRDTELERLRAELEKTRTDREEEARAARSLRTALDQARDERDDVLAGLERIAVALESFSEDYRTEDGVAADAERFVRHMSNYTADVRRILAAKNEALAQAEATAERLRAELANVQRGADTWKDAADGWEERAERLTAERDEQRQRAEQAEATIARIRTAVINTYGEDYDGEDVAAEVERLLRHLSEYEANARRILQAKNEALERAEAERDAAHAAIVNARKLHYPITVGAVRACNACSSLNPRARVLVDWPCRTLAALDASSAPESQETKPDWRERAYARVGDRVAARMAELNAEPPMSAEEFDEAMRRNKEEAEAALHQQSVAAFGAPESPTDAPTAPTRPDDTHQPHNGPQENA